MTDYKSDIRVLDRYESTLGMLSINLPKACPFWGSKLTEIKENSSMTFEFYMPMEHPSGGPGMVQKDGYVVINYKGRLLNFEVIRIEESNYRNNRAKYVYCEYGWSELNGTQIRPTVLEGVSAEQALINATTGTRWTIGNVGWFGIETFEISNYMSALEFIHEIATKFEAELKFEVRLSTSGQVVERVVNLVEKVGSQLPDVHFTYKKNLAGATRIQDRTTIATALIGIGKGNESGEELTFKDVSWEVVNGDPVDKPLGQDWVGDPEALQRWGGGNHIEKRFETNTTNPEVLLRKTWEKLQEIKNGLLTYEVDIALIGDVEIGQKVLVQDMSFSPELMVYARVSELERSLNDESQDKAIISEFVPAESSIEEELYELQRTLRQKEVIWQTGENIIKSDTTPTGVKDNQLWLELKEDEPDVLWRWDEDLNSWEKADRTELPEMGGQVNGNQIQNNAVGNSKLDRVSADRIVVETADIKDASIISAKIAYLSVNTAHIVDAAIEEAKISDLAVTNAKIANLAVTSGKIDDLAVTTAKIANLAVDSAKIQNAAITNAKIGSLAVDSAKIQDAAITSAKIEDLAVTQGKIANASINSAKIEDAAIVTAKIFDLAVNNAKIDNLAVSTGKIQDAAITNAKIASLAVGEANIQSASISTAKIQDAAIVGAKIANATINTANIADAAITNVKIENGAITSVKIGDAQIDTAKIATGAITTALLGDAVVGTAQLADASVTSAKIVELTANKITTGTLSVDRLLVTGPNSILYELNVNSVGELSASELTLDGEGITPRSVTADKIVANSITGNEISANTVTANEMLTGTITAASGIIADAAITTAKIANLAVTDAKIANIDAQKITTGVLDAGRVTIGSGTTFATGYDPTTKATPADVQNAETDAKSYTDNQVSPITERITLWEYPGTTYIDGGNIYTNTITANEIATGTITAASGILADAVITTAKIANAAVTNAKIDSLSAEKITTGVLDAARVRIGTASLFETGYDPTTKATPTDVQNAEADAKSYAATKASQAEENANQYTNTHTGNLVNNPAVSGNNDRWTAALDTQLFFGQTIPVLLNETNGNVQEFSYQFPVDPSKAYQVSMWFRKNEVQGRLYLGLDVFEDSGVQIGIERVSTGGTSAGLDSNFYFYYSNSGNSPTDWVQVVAYIMPAGTNPADMADIGSFPSGSASTTNAIFDPRTSSVRLRFLNWDNTTTTQLWAANPKVVEVDPLSVIKGTSAYESTTLWKYANTTFIDGGNIYTNTITASKIAAGAITANELAANSVTSDKINVSSLSAISANVGSLSGGTITGTSIVGGSITSNTDINVTTDLNVGDNIYIGNLADTGVNKSIYFNNQVSIWSAGTALNSQAPVIDLIGNNLLTLRSNAIGSTYGSEVHLEQGFLSLTADGSMNIDTPDLDLTGNFNSNGQVRADDILSDGNIHAVGQLTGDVISSGWGSLDTIVTREIRGEHLSERMLQDHLNGNVTLSAQGGELFLGYTNTEFIRMSSRVVHSDYKFENGYNMWGVRAPYVNNDTYVTIAVYTSVTMSSSTSGYVDVYYPITFDDSTIFAIAQATDGGSFSYNNGVYNMTPSSCRVYLNNISGYAATATINVTVVACGRLSSAH